MRERRLEDVMTAVQRKARFSAVDAYKGPTQLDVFRAFLAQPPPHASPGNVISVALDSLAVAAFTPIVVDLSRLVPVVVVICVRVELRNLGHVTTPC
jgi:hypothetical protein